MKNISFLLLTIIFVCAGCNNQPAYKNTKLSAEERAEALLKELTLEEKVSLMMDESSPVERLGIKTYNWWNEALHGIARNGLATVFPMPIGMAATFDPQAVNRIFVATSDEARAKNTKANAEGSYKRYEGLTVWTPNINIYRDPRWGRGIETYGEDPYLTSVLGVEVVKGLQCLDENEKYDKMHACAKHYAVHSGPEWNRHEFDAKNIKPRDLYETYLPAFEALVKEADVKEVMCAYNRFEGEPCCGSDELLISILREEWGYDGIVVSDCWAINDFYRKEHSHQTHLDAESASADAVLSGTDLECGGSYKALVESVKRGLINEKDIDVSVKRLLKARFELGEMDDPSEVSWTKIPFSVVASAEHDALALDMARKTMTLLQNKNNILPLKKEGMTYAVMGPNANDSVMQWGNYNGIPPRTITMLEGIRNALGNTDKLMYVPGCSWVEKTLIRSVYDQCRSKQGKGFSARYWNSSNPEGEPAAEVSLPNPFNLCTAGATVFAPGVNLKGFSGIYESVFTPDFTGEVIFNFYVCGEVQLNIDGQKVANFQQTEGDSRKHAINVEKGKSYDINIIFKQTEGDAQINFDMGFKEEINIPKTVAQVKEADVVIFVGGISPRLEGEEMSVDLPGFRKGDRTDIELPAVQRQLLKALKAAGKKIVLVNCSGSPIGLEPETQTCDAILQAWYPGQAGGKAVAEVLFGEYNPSGRLPVTFYKNVNQLPDFEDYNMTGRTYRYLQEKPLFPFGYGLSYTTFTYGDMQLPASAKINETFKVTIPVTNSGQMDGDEIVQLYLKKQGDDEGPIKALRAFQRVHIPAGKTIQVELTLSPKQLEWWDQETNSMRTHEGSYEIMVGNNSENLKKKTIKLM